MAASAKDRALFVAQLTRALPDRPVHLVECAAALLIRHATTHGHLAEAECNGPGDWVHSIPYPRAGEIIDAHQKRIEKRQAQLEARMAAICAELGLRADFGGDPRGYTVKVHLPTGASNTWGGREDGYGVPQ